MRQYSRYIFSLSLFYLYIVASCSAWAGNGGQPEEHEFIRACRNGDVVTVRRYSDDESFNVNQPLVSGRSGEEITGFFVACQEGQDEVVRILLPKTPVEEINKQWRDGVTAFFMACQKGQTRVVRQLLKVEGIDVNLPWLQRITPVDIAKIKGYWDIETLIKGGSVKEPIDTQPSSLTGETYDEDPFLSACREGDDAAVAEYLRDESYDVNRVMKSGKSGEDINGFFLACQNGHKDVVERLLPGISSEQLNKRWHNGVTAFYMACQGGHTDVVRLLAGVEGIDMSAPWIRPVTPVQIARKHGHDRTLSLCWDVFLFLVLFLVLFLALSLERSVRVI